MTWRASAETARFAKALAVETYGKAPHHGYCFGGTTRSIRSSPASSMVLTCGTGPFLS